MCLQGVEYFVCSQWFLVWDLQVPVFVMLCFVLFLRNLREEWGFEQPDELGIKGHFHLNLETELEVLKARLAQEMFKGITREVVEETGIPADSLVRYPIPAVQEPECKLIPIFNLMLLQNLL